VHSSLYDPGCMDILYSRLKREQWYDTGIMIFENVLVVLLKRHGPVGYPYLHQLNCFLIHCYLQLE